MSKQIEEPQLVEGLTNIILALKPSARKKLWNKLIEAHALSEDEEDVLLIESRRKEPARPYKEIREELKKSGRL